MSAANDGKIDKINESLNKGADINYQNSTRVTALHFAARNFQDGAVATLLRPRNNFLISNDIANVNAKDNDDLTPLDYVIKKS